MTSTMSRRRHNYISLLDISCRINCIVSACPLCDSRVSVAPSVALGDVAIRDPSETESRLIPQPFRVRRCPARAIPPMFYISPLATTSLISSPWSFNYQQSVFGHVLQSPGVQLAEDFREAFLTLWLIVIYARNLCRSGDAEINIVWYILVSLVIYSQLARGTFAVCLNCLQRDRHQVQ